MDTLGDWCQRSWAPNLLPLAVLALSACALNPSPAKVAEKNLGPDTSPFADRDDDDGSPEHRAGFPCLACHSEKNNSGEELFELAGTIYLYATDERGLDDAQVKVRDAAGHEFVANTNKAGNFMVRYREGSTPSQRKRGKYRIPWHLEFPLQISISHDGTTVDMESLAWREGSCAGCHTGDEDGAGTVSKIYLLEPGQ